MILPTQYLIFKLFEKLNLITQIKKQLLSKVIKSKTRKLFSVELRYIKVISFKYFATGARPKAIK